MTDVLIRTTGRAGRITLSRPQSLNALTWEMCNAIEAALDAWRDDDAVELVVIDAAGDRAFCSGGDIAEMYHKGCAGDFDFGRRFWTEEYRLNAKVAEFPKPYVAFMQGYTMGGGVGVSCHGSHRVVGATTQVAMPECAIGIIPDVGGSLILSRTKGCIGHYIGTTGYRMGPGDAILAGFADTFMPEEKWPALIERLETSGDPACIADAARPAPEAPLAAIGDWIHRHYDRPSMAEVMRSLDTDRSDISAKTRKALSTGSPLAVACTHEAIARVRGATSIRRALELEYRFTYRAMEESDFLEGIRAAIIDKDRRPNWRHGTLEDVTEAEVAHMLMPLGADRLVLD